MKKLLKEIKQNCSDIIEIYKHTESFLYRGLKNPSGSILKLVPREDRSPKNMSLNFHHFINKCMDFAGLGVNRSNGVFVTANAKFAESFGKVYMFFPVNGYYYIWSDDIIDFTFFKMIDIIFDNYGKYGHSFRGWIFFVGNDMRNKDARYYVIEKNRKTALNEIKKYFYEKAKDSVQKRIISISKDLKFFENENIKSLIYNDDGTSYDLFFLSWIRKYAVDAFESPFFTKEISDVFKTIYKKNENIEYLMLRSFSNEIIFRCNYYYAIEKDLFYSDSRVYDYIMS